MDRREFTTAAAAALAALAHPAALAQAWPAKTISWVYAYAPGGGGDPMARLLAESVGKQLRQQIIIENKTGASGTVGATAVARAAPDGHTFLFGVSSELVINPSLLKKMQYAPEKDFVPVSLVAKLPLLLVAGAGSGIGSVDDLMRVAKASPGKLAYASPGAGTLQHLSFEMVQRMLGIELTHIPYRGVAAAVTDLVGGQVPVGFVGLPTALPHIRTGKLVPLGLSSARPSDSAPEIAPLARHRLLKTLDVTQWFGVVAPTGTPRTIVDRMAGALRTSLEETNIKAGLYAQGAVAFPSTPEQFGTFMAAERARYAEIIKVAGITAD